MNFLISAARTGNIGNVRELLDRGVDPDIQDNFGDTALIEGADNEWIVELLLEYDADPNIRNINGNTALLLTAFNGHIDIVELLLENGADPNIRDNDGNTAYDNAIQSDNMEIAQLIQDHIDIDTYDELSDSDEPSDPDPDLLKDEAARYIQTIMRARIETDKKRKFTKRRYGKWSSPKTEREKDRRYMDLIRQIDDDDSMRGYERYSIYPERLLPSKKGGKRRKYYTRRRY
jgi:hypothetical protein